MTTARGFRFNDRLSLLSQMVLSALLVAQLDVE